MSSQLHHEKVIFSISPSCVTHLLRNNPIKHISKLIELLQNYFSDTDILITYSSGMSTLHSSKPKHHKKEERTDLAIWHAAHRLCMAWIRLQLQQHRYQFSREQALQRYMYLVWFDWVSSMSIVSNLNCMVGSKHLVHRTKTHYLPASSMCIDIPQQMVTQCIRISMQIFDVAIVERGRNVFQWECNLALT